MPFAYSFTHLYTMFIPLVNFLVMLLHFFILTFQDLKVVLCGPPNYEKGSRTNAVVLDAGSTGSRAVIFNLLVDSNNQVCLASLM